MTHHRFFPAIAAAALVLAGGSAWAQSAASPDEPPKARLERFDRQLRELREIVLQARATGKPVEVREAGPDPDVAALQAKFDDLGQSLRSITGQFESHSHDIDLLKKDDAAVRAENAALADRVDKLEKLVTNLTAPPPPPPSTAAAPPTPRPIS